ADGADPAAGLQLEAADDDRCSAVLSERGREAALGDGLIEGSETVGDVRLTIFRASAGKSREVLYLRRDRKLVIATNRDVLKKMVERWNGDGTDTLRENQAIVTHQRFVREADDAPSHALWYVAPVDRVRK